MNNFVTINNYKFAINKIYFNNEKTDAWDSSFKEFYQKNMKELENYNKTKTGLEAVKQYGGNTSQVQSLFQLVGGIKDPPVSLNPYELSDIQQFNKIIYNKLFEINENDSNLVLDLAAYFFDNSQSLINQSWGGHSLLVKSLDQLMNYTEMKNKLQQIQQDVAVGNVTIDQFKEEFEKNMLKIFSSKKNIKLQSYTFPEKSNQEISFPQNEIILFTEYYNIKLAKDLNQETAKGKDDIFILDLTDKFFADATELIFNNIKNSFMDASHEFWNKPIKNFNGEIITRKYSSNYAKELERFFNNKGVIFKTAMEKGLRDYKLTISVDKLGKGFFGEAIMQAAFEPFAKQVIQIGNSPEYTKLRTKNDKGEIVHGGQTPADLIIELEDGTKIRLQAKQWSNTSLQGYKDGGGFGHGKINYLPLGKNINRFYSIDDEKNILGIIQSLGANAYVAQQLKLDPLKGEDFTHLYLGTLNIINYYDYVAQEVNGNDLYSFRGRLVPGCYILMQLFEYVKRIAEGGTVFRSLKPQVNLEINTSGEAAFQENRAKHFKSVKSYSENNENLIDTAMTNFTAEMMGLNMSRIVERIFKI